MDNTVPPSMIRDLITGYTKMATDRMQWGWEPTLLTFMFNQLRGSPSNVEQQMQETIEAVYAKILRWCFRKPRNVPVTAMPLWICTPDYPVHKYHKQNFRDIALNGGRHVHAIALMPPGTNMRTTLDNHFDHEQIRYTGRDRPLWHIDAWPIQDNLPFVVDYGVKGIKTPRAGVDAMFILPRTHSEMEGRRAEKAYLSDIVSVDPERLRSGSRPK
ncbi:hypothetical protein [Mesorhizobium sp. B2-3-15]|uniref:hypothetical protein n=1 Tax=Mesorhizobium sp. B2-3-15 TaxID=2589949 RepID=UPI001126872A|nr:hypothetical protein [Mesorhizobium sp. B2-3-15]TPL72308.1 hypothetical protein FJ954_16575 [Mesorhizobium sp. B2-3-15]